MHASHEAYLATLATDEQRARVIAVRDEIENRVPGCHRCISYNIPALRLGGDGGEVFCFVAGFKQHTGMYPPLHAPEALVAATAAYRGPKGNLSFPHAQPLPLPLIGQLAQALAAQAEQRLRDRMARRKTAGRSVRSRG